jgi:hypothetical protein
MSKYSQLIEQLRREHQYRAYEAIEELVNRNAILEAELRYAYLECESAIQGYDWEEDLKHTDVAGMVENMRQTIKTMRDKAIPDNRYRKINKNNDAWRAMLNIKDFLDDCRGYDEF